MQLSDKIQSQEVLDVLAGYPAEIQQRLQEIRRLIIEVALENPEIGDLQETLKWGEISYLSKPGSTIRVAWKPLTPDQYGLYFNCNTSLVETIKEVYRDRFKYEGKRAIIFAKDEKLPVNELTHCLYLALNYHKLKHLPLLGI